MPDYPVRLSVHGYVEILVKDKPIEGAAMDHVEEEIETNGYGEVIEDAYSDIISVDVESARVFIERKPRD